MDETIILARSGRTSLLASRGCVARDAYERVRYGNTVSFAIRFVPREINLADFGDAAIICGFL